MSSRPRTLAVSGRHLLILAMVLFVLVVASASTAYRMTADWLSRLDVPLLTGVGVRSSGKSEDEAMRHFVQQNLNAMAVKIGEMQAQLTRLDALGERLSTLAGIGASEFRFSDKPGLGGTAPTLEQSQELSLQEFSQQLAALSRDVESRTDMMGVLESRLYNQLVRDKLMPTMMPVAAPFNASGFGQRIDPITGRRALHEGIDFIADTGTPIVAAAAGVVLFSGYHPGYGQVIDIDHGNDLVTRYAHCSRLLVKEGDVVKRGDRIALIGSTGRSTGPHLHFEVRHRGVARNPMNFLRAGSTGQTPLAKSGSEDVAGK